MIISNQSGIGRGLLTDAQYQAVQEEVVTRLSKHGVTIAASYYCPHQPKQRCTCRKPQPGLLLRAAEELRLDLTKSWMIGDKMSDVEAGTAGGCRTALINRKFGDPDSAFGAVPNLLAPDWSSLMAANLIPLMPHPPK